MTESRKSRKFLGQTTWPRRALPCLDLDNICRTQPRASSAPKICPKRESFAAVATSNMVIVHDAENDVTAMIRRTRILHDVGDLVSGRPKDIHLVYSQHRCSKCRLSFNADTSDHALPKAHYTHRVVSLAVRLVVEDGLPYQTASWHLWRDHRVFAPYATIQNWVEAGEKRRSAKSTPSTSTGPWLSFPATSPSMKCTAGSSWRHSRF